MPVSSLTCTRPARSRLGRDADRRRTARSTRPRRRAAASATVQLLGAERAHHEHRRLEPGVAQLDRLGGRRDREPPRPAGERRARARDRAVAVPVGLDHRAQRRLAGPSARRAGGATLRSIAATFTRASARSVIGYPARDSASARGSAAITSRAITPSGRSARAASRPAPACTSTAAHAAANGSIRFARYAPMHPREDVSGARGRERRRAAAADRDATVRVRDERVVALQHDDRPRGRRRRLALASRRGLDRLAVRLEQPRQLAGVRASAPWRAPRRRASRASRRARSARRRRAAAAARRFTRQAPRELERPGPSPEPRPQHERVRAAARARAPCRRRARSSDPSASGSGTVITSSRRTSKIRFSDAGTHAVT